MWYASRVVSTPQLELESVEIAVLGSFNPPIFQPAWLNQQGLITAPQASAALSGPIVLPELCSFTADWLSLQVTPDRFGATTLSDRAPDLRDFVVNLFQLLEHTPVTRTGINHMLHFRMPSAVARDDLGFRLAPANVWPKGLEDPRMRSIRVVGSRPQATGRTTVTVEPSVKIPVGVFVHTNHELATPSTVEVRTFLRDEFDSMMTFSSGFAAELTRVRS